VVEQVMDLLEAVIFDDEPSAVVVPIPSTLDRRVSGTGPKELAFLSGRNRLVLKDEIVP
jgi:hypothetical protein